MATSPRPGFATALAESGVLAALAGFDARVVGTPPLGLDLPGSDIDVVCHAPDGIAFAHRIWEAFAHEQCFALRQWRGGERAIIAAFEAFGWPFEIFAAPRPVQEQAGWRHFEVERRLLALGGAALRERVMARRRAGMKTEPAFADALGLAGDPYRAMIDLYGLPDDALARLVG